MSVEINISRDSAELTATAALEIAGRIKAALKVKSRVRLVLTGGTLGIQVLGDLALQEIDLSRVDVFWGDERFVELDSDDRNEHQALLAWPQLAHAKTFRFPAPNIALDEAAEKMNSLITSELGELDHKGSVFDVLILGMGPDGHIASLFPGHVQEEEWVVAEPNSPKPPAHRLSFSLAALNRASHLIFLASGAGKAEAVGCALQESGCDLPAAKVLGIESTTWFIDQELSRAL